MKHDRRESTEEYLHELGRAKRVLLIVRIEYSVYPEIRKTYDSPGEPEQAELEAVHVLEYESDRHSFVRKRRPDWWVWKRLDEIAEDVLRDPDKFEAATGIRSYW